MEQIFGLVLSAIFGAIFGSYATLFAYRLPRGESCFGRYFGKKSRCPNCESIIKTRDLIPLLNWFFTLGSCRVCKIKIPRIHFFVELSTTLLFVFCYLKFSFSEGFMIHAMICVGLVILMACDFTHKNFPQAMLIFILMFVVANRVLVDQTTIEMVYSAVVGVIFSVIFYQIFYKKTSGFFFNEKQVFDYTKFILIAALYLQISFFLFYFFTVMVILTAMLVMKIPSKKPAIGFGYALIIPFIGMMFLSPISIN
jgi:prepilin signal peptidase PulO-like enzyme (type II secretory pathway)